MWNGFVQDTYNSGSTISKQCSFEMNTYVISLRLHFKSIPNVQKCLRFVKWALV